MSLFGTVGAGAEQALTIVIRARNEAEQVLKNTEKQINSFSSSNKAMLKDLQKVSGVATAAFGALAGLGINTARQLETAQIGLKTLLGSADDAAKTVERVKKEAARTPFEIAGLTQATQLLSSVTHDGDKAIDILLNVGEALAAMGKGQAELDRIIINLQQVAAVGHAAMIDIKQFAFAGIPIFDMLQEKTGLAGDALNDFISNGGVTFELLTQMFDEANDAGGRFFGAFENAAGSFDQTWSNMMDTVNTTLAELVNESGIFDFLKKLMKGFTDFVENNKFLVKTLVVTGGAISTLIFALSSLALVLPKVITFTKLAFTTLGGWPLLIGVIATAVVTVTQEFANFADEVGGFGRAWQLWMLDIESQFLGVVRSILQGIDTVTRHIPFIGDAVSGALNSVTAQLEKTNEKFSTLAVEGFQEVERNAREVKIIGKDAFDTVGDAAAASAEDVKKANDAIAETEKKLADLQKGFLSDVADERTSLAEAYVNQEQKVQGLRVQLAEETDQEKRNILQAQLQQEQKALEDASQIEINLQAEVVEERRRMRLTDFEREVEDIRARLVERTNEFAEKVALLNAELEEKEKQKQALFKIEAQVTDNVKTEVKAREDAVVSSVDTQISKYGQLAQAATAAAVAMASAGSGGTFFGIGGVSTPALPHFAHGGLVDAPAGRAVPAILHGGERVIPAHAADTGGGTTIVNNFPNLTIRSREDIAELEKMMETFFRRVLTNHKLTFS